MKNRLFVTAGLLSVVSLCNAQNKQLTADGTIDHNTSVNNYNRSQPSSFKNTSAEASVNSFATKAANESNHKRAGKGYIIYKNTTLEGEVVITKDAVKIDKPVDGKQNFTSTIKLDDPGLKKVVINNKDARPLCIVRVQPNDNRMVRLYHEGKLNIYDSRILCEFKPEMLESTHIITANNGNVKELNTSKADISKQELAGQINTIYGLKLDPATMTWKQLTDIIEKLD